MQQQFALFFVNSFAILQARPVPRLNDPGAGLIVFLIFAALLSVAIVVFTVVAIVVSSRRRSDRSAKLRALGQQIGFSYIQKPAVPDFLRNTVFAQRAPGTTVGGMTNLLQGNVNGVPVLIFDYTYTKPFLVGPTATYICIPRGSNPPFTFPRATMLVPPENIRMVLDEALKAFDQDSQDRKVAPVSA